MSVSDISCDAAVIGAGVLGLASAALLGARGLSVAVIDPGGENASSVAAGMIAPGMESATEGVTPDRAALLRRAAGRWPAFADHFGLELIEEAAEWRGPDPDDFLTRLKALGFSGARSQHGVTVAGEARIEPTAALDRLTRAPGVRPVAKMVERAERREDGWRLIMGGEVVTARRVVIATGAAGPIAGLPNAAARLIASVTPVRGQLLRVGGRLARTVRDAEGYAAPAAAGLVAGATMDVGRRDLTPDPAVTARQADWLNRLLGLDGHGRPQVGVRGASADGLPIAGDVGEAVHLALAPRRNGWLLAPLIAEALVGEMLDGDPPVAAFDPGRRGLA